MIKFDDRHIDSEGISKMSSFLNELSVQKGINKEFDEILRMSSLMNPWFTENNIRESLAGLSHMLKRPSLESWMEKYGLEERKTSPKKVGLVLAGNIPMVGFHDVFCVAMAGHKPVVKLSSQDSVLLPYIFDGLNSAIGSPFFEIEWIEGRLPDVDAIIATGSNNTARYFEYYFGKKPNIIRKNRNSVGIISGSESREELEALGSDIFSYFGLGCRNVSKLYVHEDFDLDDLFRAIFPYKDLINHHKYANNYDYYKALWLMNREDLLENGFVILRPSEAIASPIATIFYERYSNEDELYKSLVLRADEIQCIVSKKDVPFGKSQEPELWDYADGVDTMEFLLGLG
jgi:hypothetical protein